MGSKKIVKFNKKRTVEGRISQNKWVVNIILATFVISTVFSFVSELLLRNVEVLVAFIILILIIMTGIVFDIIGVAVTAADETPFHSMASRKLAGARTSVSLIRNASKISNFCNDVIGDICGILSGAAGTVIINRIIFSASGFNRLLPTILLSSSIASLTVGGKAIGKHFAISESNNIIYWVGYAIEKVNNLFIMKK